MHVNCGRNFVLHDVEGVLGGPGDHTFAMFYFAGPRRVVIRICVDSDSRSQPLTTESLRINAIGICIPASKQFTVYLELWLWRVLIFVNLACLIIHILFIGDAWWTNQTL